MCDERNSLEYQLRFGGSGVSSRPALPALFEPVDVATGPPGPPARGQARSRGGSTYWENAPPTRSWGPASSVASGAAGGGSSRRAFRVRGREGWVGLGGVGLGGVGLGGVELG